MHVAQLGCSCPGAELDCTSARVPSTASLPVLGVGNAPVTGHVELYTELMGVWWLTCSNLHFLQLSNFVQHISVVTLQRLTCTPASLMTPFSPVRHEQKSIG